MSGSGQEPLVTDGMQYTRLGYRPYDPPENFKDWLRLVRDVPEEHYDTVHSDLFIDLDLTVRRLAPEFANKFRIDKNTHLNDLVSLTTEALLALVKDVREGKLDPETVQSPTSLLNYRARSLVRRWIDSSAGLNVASSQVNTKRRFHEMKRTIEIIWARDGREPTGAEVVKETNERLIKTRKDPAHSAILCKLEHYELMMQGGVVALDAVNESRVAVPDPNEVDGKLTEIDLQRIARAVILECRKRSETLGRVAEVWVMSWIGGDKPAPGKDVATKVGISTGAANTKIQEVMAITCEFAKLHGIERG